MQIIINNSGNTIYCTATENIPFTGTSYFQMVLTHTETNYSKTFNLIDTSDNVCRYNKFPITLTGSTFENLTGSSVYLINEGIYNYNLYASTGNTLSTTGSTLVENGQILVSGITINYPVTINNNYDTQINFINKNYE